MAQRKPQLLSREALHEYALRALGGRAHSISELAEKLRRRAEDQSDVARVLASLKQEHLLDDRRFAESFASARLENEGFGRMRVLRDLRQKRVAPALAEQAVTGAYRDVDEVSLIEAFLARKFRTRPLAVHLEEPRHMASVYRKLRLAGFSSGNSIRVLKRYAEQADELASLEDEEPET